MNDKAHPIKLRAVRNNPEFNNHIVITPREYKRLREIEQAIGDEKYILNLIKLIKAMIVNSDNISFSEITSEKLVDHCNSFYEEASETILKAYDVIYMALGDADVAKDEVWRNDAREIIDKLTKF